MKYKNILSVLITNGLSLLVFVGVLSSCQKNHINKTGLYSTYKGPLSRSIASVPKKQKIKFYDTKQIYIHCKVKTKSSKACYEQLHKSMLNDYTKKYGPFSPSELTLLESHYTDTEKEIKSISAKMLSELSPKMNEFINKRVSFCKKNSKFYFNRCLHQYIQKDSFQVLNHYQNKHKNINGNEYLFLKDVISERFKSEFKEVNTKYSI